MTRPNNLEGFSAQELKTAAETKALSLAQRYLRQIQDIAGFTQAEQVKAATQKSLASLNDSEFLFSEQELSALESKISQILTTRYDDILLGFEIS